MRGELWWSMRTVGDGDGFVRIRVDEGAPDFAPWGWAVVRAEGYAPAAAMHSLPGEYGIADGIFVGPDPRAGDAIVLPGGEPAPGVVDLPVRFVLEGDGPRRLTPPTGELRIEVTDERGAPLEAGATIGETGVAIDGAATLRRLRPGRDRIFITAEGRRSAIVQATVPATRDEPTRVVLPARP